jgi:hypothetical protein
VFVLGYVALREAAPFFSRPGASPYEEMDGPALAALAQKYWADHGTGPIPYIVSFGGKVGFQAAGSIAFDLPYHVRVLKDGSTNNAPWIDIADIRRRGALVVAGKALEPKQSLQGLEVSVRDADFFYRPLAPRAKQRAPKIYFGVIAPDSPSEPLSPFPESAPSPREAATAAVKGISSKSALRASP